MGHVPPPQELAHVHQFADLNWYLYQVLKE